MKRMVILLSIILALALNVIGQATKTQNKASGKDEKASLSNWRTSYNGFAQAIMTYSGEKPIKKFTSVFDAALSLMYGQAVPPTSRIMQQYGWRTVTWEGAFEGIGEEVDRAEVFRNEKRAPGQTKHKLTSVKIKTG